MTADLRRLAEQARDTYHDHAAVKVSDCPMCLFRAAADPQTILALLDERDYLRMTRRGFSSVTLRQAEAAERRVAALEEGLRALVQDMDSQNVGTNVLELTDPPIWRGLLGGKPYAKARALLEKNEVGSRVHAIHHSPQKIESARRTMSDRRRYGSLLCPDCGHHLHRPNPGICQWYDCGCPAEAAAPAGLDVERLALALGAVIESRMSRDLAWTQDDGKTIIRLNAEQAGWHLAHLASTEYARLSQGTEDER